MAKMTPRTNWFGFFGLLTVAALFNLKIDAFDTQGRAAPSQNRYFASQQTRCLSKSEVSLMQSAIGIKPFEETSENLKDDPQRPMLSRRAAIGVALSTAALSSQTMLSMPLYAFADATEDISSPTSPKVLVLGGTGLVGTEVVKQLKLKGIDFLATSRNGRDGTKALDVSSGVDVSAAVQDLAKGCTAVISTIGSINSPVDEVVNGASGLAAKGAKKAGAKHFVYISNAPEVRSSVGGLDFLKGYMAGKLFSENTIKESFGPSSSGGTYMLIQPTFIYGGDKFELNPPRVASGYGKLVEGLLSTGPFRLAANVLPGFAGLALEPPVSASDVAGAAVAGALASTSSVLDTHDKIVETSKSIQ